MALSSRKLVLSTAALLLVGLAALAVVVLATVWLFARSQTYFAEVIEARNMRAAVVDLRRSFELAESSERAFLLTGREATLADYAPFRAAVPFQAERLRRLAANDQAIASRLTRAEALLAGRFAEMDRAIALRRSGQAEQAIALGATEEGLAQVGEARALFAAMIDAADTRLAASVEEQRTNTAWLRLTAIIAFLVIVGVVAGSALAVIRYARDLVATQNEVRALNVGLEERVAERTADLARANEEVQRFAYIVTHDLRAPLVNIMGFTAELETSVKTIQQLIETPEADAYIQEQARAAALEDLPEAIRFIRSSTGKMDGLINAILKLSREGRRVLKPERIDLGALVEAAVAAIQHQITEAEGTVSLDVRVPAIVSDRLALEQVVGNLLDNCVKYRARERPLAVAVTVAPEGQERVVIAIADNGRGIPEQDRERVFEPFRRSGAQDQRGEGIGLAYVRAAARNLGGDVTLESTVGRGSTFRVTLPRSLRVNRNPTS